jgi:hypothetical protein
MNKEDKNALFRLLNLGKNLLCSSIEKERAKLLLEIAEILKDIKNFREIMEVKIEIKTENETITKYITNLRNDLNIFKFKDKDDE